MPTHEEKAREISKRIAMLHGDDYAPDTVADVLVEALRQAESDALERAAKCAEDYQSCAGEFGPDEWSFETLERQSEIAKSIRALANHTKERK